MSKELFDYSPNVKLHHTKESDIWAFGMVIHVRALITLRHIAYLLIRRYKELLAQEEPYAWLRFDPQLLNAIISDVLPNRPLFYSAWPVELQETWDLCVKSCWPQIPAERDNINILVKKLSSLSLQVFDMPRAKELRIRTTKALALRSKLSSLQLDPSMQLYDISKLVVTNGQDFTDSEMFVGFAVSREIRRSNRTKVAVKRLRVPLQEHDFEQVRNTFLVILSRN